jgi:hypothetical protein
MKTQTDSKTPCGFIAAFGVFAGGVLCLWCFPAVRALVFPYDLLAVRDGNQQWHLVLDHTQAMRLGLIHWSLAALTFGALARKEHPVVLIPAMLAALTLITAATYKTVAWLGMDFHWSFWG